MFTSLLGCFMFKIGFSVLKPKEFCERNLSLSPHIIFPLQSFSAQTVFKSFRIPNFNGIYNIALLDNHFMWMF